MARQQLPLRLGDTAPPFTLGSSAGQDIRLTDVLQTSVVMVVFIRGTW